MPFKVKYWGFIGGFEFYDYPISLMHKLSLGHFFLWLILLLSHTVICALPFIMKKTYYKNALIIAPIIFVVSYSIFNLFFLFVLIPFIFFWIISLTLITDVRQIVKNG